MSSFSPNSSPIWAADDCLECTSSFIPPGQDLLLTFSFLDPLKPDKISSNKSDEWRLSDVPQTSTFHVKDGPSLHTTSEYPQHVHPVLLIPGTTETQGQELQTLHNSGLDLQNTAKQHIINSPEIIQNTYSQFLFKQTAQQKRSLTMEGTSYNSSSPVQQGLSPSGRAEKNEATSTSHEWVSPSHTAWNYTSPQAMKAHQSEHADMMRDQTMKMDFAAPNHGGSSGSGDIHASDRYHALILQLERSNRELQQRLTSLEGELLTSERQRMHVESKLGDLKEAADDAQARATQKEQAMVALQQHADAVASELRSCLSELKQEKERVAAGRDEVVQLKDDVEDLKKQLQAAAKKIDQVGEDDRRQLTELLQLRKEHQVVQEALQRTRIDLADARERLTNSEAAVGKQQLQVAKSHAEGGGAVMQLHALRAKVVDLEAKNEQLTAHLNELVVAHPDIRSSKNATGSTVEPSGAYPRLSNPITMPYHYRSSGLPNPSEHQVSISLGPSDEAHASMEPSRWIGSGTNTAAGAVAAGMPGTKSEPVKALLYSGGSQWEGAGNQGSSIPSVQQSQHHFSSREQGAASQGTSAGMYSPIAGMYSSGPGLPLASTSHREEALQALQSRPVQPETYEDALELQRYMQQHPPSTSRTTLKTGGNSHWRSIESRLLELQAAEDAIKARLADHDRHIQQPPSSTNRQLQYFSPPHNTSNSRQQAGTRLSLDGGYGYADQFRSRDQQDLYLKPETALPSSSHYAMESESKVQGSFEPNDANAPFGTERNAREMLARSKHLEDSLIALCGEKSLLESEMSKMSAGSGRSLKERRRKAEVQQRLETLGREISGTRMQLKKITGR